MAVLNKAKIENFQSHADTVLEFSPGVNVFIGPSHNGKSAVYRALRWNCMNDPDGDAFIRHGEKDCSVLLSWDDCDVERKRTPSLNGYVLDGQPMQGFRNEVPEVIRTRVPLSELNWQGQHDAPFLLSETAGEVSRRLNKLANLELIDVSLKRVGRAVLDARRHKDEREAAIVELEAELSGFKDTDALELKITRVERRRRRIDASTAQYGVFQKTLNKAVYAQKELDTYVGLDSVANAVRTAQARHTDVQARRTQCERLERVVAAAKRYERVLADTEGLVGTAARLKALREQVPHLDRLRERVFRLSQLLNGIDKAQCHLERCEVECNRVMEEYKQAVPEVCPTCGQAWPGNNGGASCGNPIE